MSAITKNEYAARRKALMEKIGKEGLAIIATPAETNRNGDTDYPYRSNSDFLYLTGFAEPEAIMVLIPGRKEGEFVLFNRERDPVMETWNGRRAGQAGAIKDFGADQAFPIKDFVTKLPELLLGRQRICYSIGKYASLDQDILSAINKLKSRVRFGVVSPIEFANIDQWVHALRHKKSSAEIELMEKAANISAKAHIRAMQACKPGMYEYELEAELLYDFYRHGSRFPAYGSIVGAGENSCILHYQENNTQIKDGDIILIDAGCEYYGYCSDITRSFPANGRYSPEQRAIYEIVLAAQQTGIAMAKPGVTLDQIHMTCVKIIVEGLVKLGILNGNVDELIQNKAYMPFYMHRTGHWLGLDTHDVGNYRSHEDWTPFEPGFVFTVEPGIYISANTPNVDKKWWNIGIRIEDDILITETGCKVLSAAVPKTIAEIEALMAKAH